MGIALAAAAVAILFSASQTVEAVKPVYPGLATVQQADNGDGTFNYRVIAKGPIPTANSLNFTAANLVA